MSATLENSLALSVISDFLRRRSAIVLDSSKAYLVETRLAPIARRFGFDSIESMSRVLEAPSNHQLAQSVVDAMTTNETSFFRDLHPFNALRDTVVPRLIAEKAKVRTLTIWSNACSTGQEVYSIAMVLKEHFPELANWNVRLVATDISTQVLSRASEGIFNQSEVNRGLPSQLLVKYFERRGPGWQITQDLRNMVEFRTLNLIEPFPTLPKIDIVFIRNVLIYFAPETKQDILKNVKRVMNPTGYMFLGGAETTMNLDVPFERELNGKAAYYKPR